MPECTAIPAAPNSLPTLDTPRLRLRPFTLADAPRVRELAGAREIASVTLLIPHPYPDGAAESWIAGHAESAVRDAVYTFAIERKSDDLLIGVIGIGRNGPPSYNRAEVGYWLGVPYWGQGYMTEAVRRILAFGFETLDFNRIFATYMTRNPASQRVMLKAGMQFEGIMRQAVEKWGVYEDMGLCAILREDFVSP